MNTKKSCIHHWLINQSDVGKCQKCGLVRDFRALQEKAKKSSHHPGKARAGGKKGGEKRKGGRN